MNSTFYPAIQSIKTSTFIEHRELPKTFMSQTAFKHAMRRKTMYALHRATNGTGFYDIQS
jgi:hypothetical protein